MPDARNRVTVEVEDKGASELLEKLAKAFESTRLALQAMAESATPAGESLDKVAKNATESGSKAEEAGKKSKQASDEAATGFEKWGQVAEQIKEKLSRLGDSVVDFGKKAAEAVKGGVTFLADKAIDLGKALLDTAGEASKWMSSMSSLARTMNTTADDAAKWEFIANKSGVSTDLLDKATTRLAVNINNAGKGYVQYNQHVEELQHRIHNLQEDIDAFGDKTGKSTRSLNELKEQLAELVQKGPAADSVFGQLGISVKNADGSLKSITEMLPQLADKFSKMADGPEKTALAIKVFGKNGEDLLPMLNKGSAGIEELRKKAQELGIALSADDLANNRKLKTAQKEIDEGFETIRRKIGEMVIPILAQLTQSVVPLVEKLIGFASNLKNDLAPALERLQPILDAITGAMGKVADALGDLLKGDFAGAAGKVGEALRGLADQAWLVVQDLINKALDWGKGLIASFSNGIVDGINNLIAPVMGQLGSMIGGFLEPHSPPKILPNLDQWGAQAAGLYLAGWTKADFSSFDSMAGVIKTHLESLVSSGALGKLDLLPILGNARQALQQAQDEFDKFGAVSSAAMQRLQNSLGPASQAVKDFITETFQLETAQTQLATAQQHLVDVQEKYKQQLDDLNKKLKQLGVDQTEALGQLPVKVQQLNNALALMRSQTDDLLHPLDLQLRDLQQKLLDVENAGAQALAPFNMAVEMATQNLQNLQNASQNGLGPLKDNLDAAKQKLADLKQAAQDAGQGFADALRPLQAQLEQINNAAAAALAPINEALSAAQERAQAFKDAAAGIAASYDAQLAPLIASLNQVKGIELQKQHAQTLHDMGQEVENLTARLKNAVPGSAEYIAIQEQLTKAQGDLQDKQKEFSTEDKIAQLEAEKKTAVDAADEKAKQADLEVKNLQKQRDEINKTFENQRKVVQDQINLIQQQQTAYQQAESQREEAAQKEVETAQKALDNEKKLNDAKIANAQRELNDARAAQTAKQTEVNNNTTAVNAEIANIQRKRDAIQFAASENERAVQKELDGYNRQISAIQQQFAARQAVVQSAIDKTKELQQTEVDQATAQVKAASDNVKTIQDQLAATQGLINEEKNAADITAQYNAALKEAAKSHGQLTGSLGDTKIGLTDTSGAIDIARDKMKNLDDAHGEYGKRIDENKGTLGDFINNLKNKWSEVTGYVGGELEHFNNLVKEKGVAHAIIQEIKEKWAIVSQTLGDLGHAAWSWLVDVAPKILHEAGVAFQNIITYLNGPFLSDVVKQGGILLGAAVKWVVDLGPEFTKKVTEFETAITMFFVNLLPKTKEAWGKVLQGIIDGLKELEKLPQKIQEWVNKAVKTLIDGFLDGFGIHSPSSKMVEIAGHIIEGFIQGLKDGVGKVGDTIKGFAGSALDGLKNAFGIHSPSEETKNLGGFLLEGLTQGMLQGQNAMQTVFTSLQGALNTFAVGVQQKATAAFTQLPGAFQTGLQPLIPIWDSLFGADAGQAGTLLNRLWGHQQGTFWSTLIAYTQQRVESWFNVVWVAKFDWLGDKMQNYLKTTVAPMVAIAGTTIGQALVTGIAEGITAGTHFVEDAASHAVQAAIAAANAAAGNPHSPAPATVPLGQALVQGIGKGVDDNAHVATSAMRSAVNQAVGIGVPSVGTASAGVGSGVTGNNIVFNIQATVTDGVLHDADGSKMDSPQYWQRYARPIGIALETDKSGLRKG